MREVRGEPNDGWSNQPGKERLKWASSHLLPQPPTYTSHTNHFFLAASHIRSGVTFSPGFASLAHLHPTTREPQPVFLKLWHQTHLPWTRPETSYHIHPPTFASTSIQPSLRTSIGNPRGYHHPSPCETLRRTTTGPNFILFVCFYLFICIVCLPSRSPGEGTNKARNHFQLIVYLLPGDGEGEGVDRDTSQHPKAPRPTPHILILFVQLFV